MSSMQELKPADFDPKERVWTRFPPEGSKTTPPHQSVEFRWKDYCPAVFRSVILTRQQLQRSFFANLPNFVSFPDTGFPATVVYFFLETHHSWW